MSTHEPRPVDQLGPVRCLERVRRAKDAVAVRESQVYAQGYFAALLAVHALDDTDARYLARDLARVVDLRLTELEAMATAEPPTFALD